MSALASSDLRLRAEAAASALAPLSIARGGLRAAAAPGPHGLRRAGAGEDFWQYRLAHEADTAATIDWRRSARGDQSFVRDRERQSPRSLVLWVGQGPGMGYRGVQGGAGAETKSDRARLIALALGLAALRGGERVAMLGQQVGQGQTQAARLAEALDGAELTPRPPAPGDLRSGQVLVLIDDFLGDPAPLDAFIAAASARGAAGLLLQVLHPDEENFPFSGAVRFETGTGQSHETADAAGLRPLYLARLEERRAYLAALASGAGFVFGTHDLGRPVTEALLWAHGVLAGR